jgi:hypothetical protein
MERCLPAPNSPSVLPKISRLEIEVAVQHGPCMAQRAVPPSPRLCCSFPSHLLPWRCPGAIITCLWLPLRPRPEQATCTKETLVGREDEPL